MNRWHVLGLQLVALWPLAGWYAKRLYWTSSLVELAPIAVGLLVLFAGARGEGARPLPRALRLPGAFMALYALSALWLPTGATAPFAVLGLASTVCALFVGWSAFVAILGLGLLALPALPLLQYELSYPLRALVAELTAPLLRAGGIAVTRSGTCLEWAGGLLWVDAPCSGVRFLWTGFLLVFSLALMHRLDNRRTLLAAGWTLLMVMAANVLRTASLFYLESGILILRGGVPEWVHPATGLAIYSLAAVALALVVHRMSSDPISAEATCAAS
ncbi:Transmembrane exosortase (Exosortase_EpsH) [Planctomycetes bacterium Poly30]|uniref:Transmembrane exosortase (Exosortase_EpsH) n=1 Tax=Saltatorellus ferox TaxID=2528018 RepID=A0A518ETR2_9BACT|nr:Transmembrane exosortase (Exosortase_EpsH) [Planctomycetes bacterium Poly30]